MNQEIKVVALTGAPCAGKTSVLKAIAQHYTDKAIFAPETATMLMNGGFPRPGKDLEYCDHWQDNFQRAVLAVQEALENTWLLVGRQRGARLLLCDRGMVDGAAYSGGMERFCQMYGVNHDNMLARYHAVVHMETMAISRPELYGKHGNETRYEDHAGAAKLDAAIREAWQKHPRRLMIEGVRSEEQQNEAVLQLIKELL